MEHGTEIDGRCKHFMWLMSIMLDHNDDVFRCLRCTMHVHRNAVVSIALWCLAAVAGRVAELLLLIQSRPRNLIYSRVITFAQILSRGNSVLLVIIAFIQNSAQHRLYVVISDWWMSPCWHHVEVGDYLPEVAASHECGDGETWAAVSIRLTCTSGVPVCWPYLAY